ncbi:MAG: ATP-binding protein [Candidatus Eisenbacteria bacterium]
MRFAVRTRVFLLLGGVLTAVLLGLFMVQQWQAEELQALFRERATRGERLITRILSLKSESISVCASDYSRWDEFVDFLSTRDPEWASENLDEGPSTYGVELLWVLTDRFEPFYATGTVGTAVPPFPPVDGAALRARLSQDPFAHFYACLDRTLIEIHAAPVQPSSDFERSSPARGWFLVGRRWTDPMLADLGDNCDGTLGLWPGTGQASAPFARSGRPPASSTDQGLVAVSIPLLDVERREAARLWLVTSFPILAEIHHGSQATFLILIATSLALVGLELYLIGRWVTRPLKQITEALRAGRAEPISTLSRHGSEFGSLAALIEAFFAQQATLEREVTERRRLELANAAERDFIRLVLDHLPNPMWVEGEGGEIELANPAFAALLPRGSALGQNLEQLLPALADLPESPIGEERSLTVGAVELRFHAARLPIRNADGSLRRVGVLHDITDAERARVELAQARDAALALSRAKSEFLANVSHELRTPMHGILSFARFGRREAKDSPREDLASYFTQIQECGDSLLGLLNSLLDLARLEAGRMEMDFGDHDLLRTIDTALDEQRMAAQEKRIALTFAPDEVELVLEIDRNRMAQVMRNLLANAIRFTPDGGEVRIEVEPRDEEVELRVLDNGPGIPAGELESIFDKFVQSSTTRSGAGGTGLGLSICQEIVRFHKGRLWASNRPEGGAAFHIVLPRERCSSALTSEPEETAAAESGASLSRSAA